MENIESKCFIKVKTDESHLFSEVDGYEGYGYSFNASVSILTDKTKHLTIWFGIGPSNDPERCSDFDFNLTQLNQFIKFLQKRKKELTCAP